MRQHDVDISLVFLPARPWDLEERDLLLIGTLGVAVLLLLILYLILFCMMLAAKKADAAEEQFDFAHVQLGELEVLHCQLCTEVTDADVTAAVDDPFAWGQLLRFGWFVVRPLGNLALLIYTAALLAQWEPKKPWDLERHIVIYGEGLAAMVLLVLLFFFALFSAVKPPSEFPNRLHAMTNTFRFASNLSSMRLLTPADPVATWTWTRRVLTKNPNMVKLQAMGSWKAFSARVMIYVFACILIPTLVGFALMALLVKVSDFSFITLGQNWAPPDFVRVLLFVNALAGLRGDVELQRRNTILGMFDGGDKAVAIRFKVKLATRMVNSHGRLGGLAAFTTISTDQMVKILKQEVRQKD